MTKPPRLTLLGTRVGMASARLAPHDVLPSMQGRTSRTGLGRFASLLPKGQDRAVRLAALMALKTGSGNEKGSTGGCRFDCWAARGRFYRTLVHRQIFSIWRMIENQRGKHD